MKTYPVTMYLKCRKCGVYFEETMLPTDSVINAKVNLDFGYEHVCEDNPQEGITIGKADVIGMRVSFKTGATP